MITLDRGHWRPTASCRLVAVVSASALACLSPTSERAPLEMGQRSERLDGASVDGSHRGVLAVLAVTPETVELCTGTLIAPNLVLTARHCVSDTSLDSLDCAGEAAYFAAPFETRSLWVNHADALSGPLQSFGLLPLTGGGGEFVAVAAVRIPDTQVVCGGDVALLILDEPMPADFEPLAPRLDEPVKTGEAYTAVGFGATRDGGAQGTRRAREGLATSCGGDDCQGRGNLAPNEVQGGDGVCFGDSGGPALAADGRVIGIASRSHDCQNSVYSAVSTWRDWIRPVAREAMLVGDYPAPTWLVAAEMDAGSLPASGDGGLLERPALEPAAPVDSGGLPPPPPSNADAAPPSGSVLVVSQRSGCSLGSRSQELSSAMTLLLVTGPLALARLRRRRQASRRSARSKVAAWRRGGRWHQGEGTASSSSAPSACPSSARVTCPHACRMRW